MVVTATVCPHGTLVPSRPALAMGMVVVVVVVGIAVVTGTQLVTESGALSSRVKPGKHSHVAPNVESIPQYVVSRLHPGVLLGHGANDGAAVVGAGVDGRHTPQYDGERQSDGSSV